MRYAPLIWEDAMAHVFGTDTPPFGPDDTDVELVKQMSEEFRSLWEAGVRAGALIGGALGSVYAREAWGADQGAWEGAVAEVVRKISSEDWLERVLDAVEGSEQL